jgi:hypothetical protein
MNKFVLFSNYFIQLLSVIPLIMHLRMNQRRPLVKSPLVFYLISNVLLIILSNIFQYYFHNCYPVFHISTLISGGLILLILKDMSVDNKILIMIFQFVLLFLCISDTFFISSIWLNNSLSNICMNIMIAITSYLVILEQVKITTLKDDTKFESNFYISMSFFILNTSVFFFSIIEHKIRSEASSLFYVSYFALLFIQLIHLIILSFGIWKLGQKRF